MLLFEFEGKALLREHGIAVPRGDVVTRAADVPAALAQIPPPLMVKAQVLSGGRGKAGGVRSADTVTEVEEAAGRLLGSTLKGHRIERLLLEERVPIKSEYYAAVTVDGHDVLVLLGAQGGVDIEAFFAQEASTIQVVPVDPLYGVQAYQVRRALERLGVRPELWTPFAAFVINLNAAFRAADATLVEVNPVAEAPDGRLVALDARIEVDEGAFFRQPRFRAIQAERVPDSPVLRTMRELEIQYVPFGGNVGLLSSGAGAGVTILDWIDDEGEKPAAFMDIDYAILSDKTEAAMRTALTLFCEDPRVRSIVVNVTSCGVRVDGIAATLVKVLRDMGDAVSKPCFIHIQGNRAAEAHTVIRRAGYRLCERLGEAVREACRAARDGRGR